MDYPYHRTKHSPYFLGGTYHRVPKVRFIEPEFVEPNPSDHFIYWLFRYRCVECKKSATEINEIIPRSRSKKAIFDWKNRVPLCKECHQNYHADGVTDFKMRTMQHARREFLKTMGREDYV
jgi:5-methylcytosine-specific restriction endonuclease McrA